jgi:hypothetical protein
MEKRWAVSKRDGRGSLKRKKEGKRRKKVI